MRKTVAVAGNGSKRRKGSVVAGGSTFTCCTRFGGAFIDAVFCHVLPLQHAPAPASRAALLSLQIVANDGHFITRMPAQLLHIIDRLWNQATSDSHHTEYGGQR